MDRCNRCVTPLTYPGLDVDETGVCNQCRDYERRYANWDAGRADRTAELETILRRARKRSTYYDALVPLSGGKDSTYVLHLATKVFKLKVLCYTFVNGFQSDVARENIAAAVRASGADHFVYAPNRGMMMRLYHHFLQHTGLFCPACMRGITAGSFFVSRQFRIPVILSGSSERTEERLAPEIFQDGNIRFFRNVLKEHPFPEDVRALLYDRSWIEKAERALFLLTRGRVPIGRMDVYLPDYMPWDYKEIYRTITTEMGWKALPDRDEHVDCEADPIVHHFIRETRVPELTANTLRFSAEIRAGQMSRSQAMEAVEHEEAVKARPKETDGFLRSLGIGEDALRRYMEDGTRHMRYQRGGLVAKLTAAIRARRTS